MDGDVANALLPVTVAPRALPPHRHPSGVAGLPGAGVGAVAGVQAPPGHELAALHAPPARLLTSHRPLPGAQAAPGSRTGTARPQRLHGRQPRGRAAGSGSRSSWSAAATIAATGKDGRGCRAWIGHGPSRESLGLPATVPRRAVPRRSHRSPCLPGGAAAHMCTGGQRSRRVTSLTARPVRQSSRGRTPHTPTAHGRCWSPSNSLLNPRGTVGDLPFSDALERISAYPDHRSPGKAAERRSRIG